MSPHTIDEVIIRLDEIIARARREQSRLGFFTTLYRNVTIKVKEGIQNGFFENGPRMEQFDVTFANRYLSALESYLQGQRPSKCWLVSFQAADSRRPLILQHLLMGINAHINFDLGIAAAEVAPGDQLPTLRHDFDQINNILAGLVLKVREEIDSLSPWINILDHISPKTDTAIINFSLDKARDSAWLVANLLAHATPAQQANKLAILDIAVADFGKLIRHPGGFLINLGLLIASMRESGDIPKIIDVLSQM
jgi:hypothetical protein